MNYINNPTHASGESNEPDERNSTSHLNYQQDSLLARYFATYGKDPKEITGFYPLSQGHDALLVRISLIESAQKSLDLQYYIYRNDETSKLMTWRLYEAAKRGVKIRLLLDDLQIRNTRFMAALNAHPNIEIRLFNPRRYRFTRPLELTNDFERLNRRMHNKSMVADNVSSIVGGRNIGNEYFSFDSVVEFGDFDLLLYGVAVQQTAEQFDLYWNSDHAVPIKETSHKKLCIADTLIQKQVIKSDLEKKFSSGRYDFSSLDMYRDLTQGKLKLFWGNGQVWFDLPDKVIGHHSQLVDNLVELLKNVESSFELISPYFIPTKAGAKALIDAAKRGVKITVVTNSLASNDVIAVHGWYTKYRKELLKSGIKLWEIKSTAKIKNKWNFTGSSRASLHAKMITIDNKILFVGSMNWDPRSAILNTEMAVVIEQVEFVNEFLSSLPVQLRDNAYLLSIHNENVLWTDLKTGEEYNSEPKANSFHRLGAWFSSVLPIEALL
ncbi:TPA: phospholipase D family protein [Vibrio parahaemolyticus]